MGVFLQVGFLACLLITSAAGSSGLNVTLTYDGTFEIRVSNQPWFTSASPFLVASGERYGIKDWVIPGERPEVDRTLERVASAWADGKDVLGPYKGVAYTYRAGDIRLELAIRAYDSMIVFSQTFPDGLNNTGVPDNRKVLSGYPAFQWDIVFQGYVASGYLTFAGPLNGAKAVRKGSWQPWQQVISDGRQASGPLCLFNVSGSDAVIISPLTQVLNLSPWHRYWPVSSIFPGTEGQSYWGIDRDIQSLPLGFKAEVILVYSPYGVGQVFEDWGRAIRQYSGQGKAADRWPAGLDKVGYWTGPGSYYYESTGQNKTYEDVILEVEKTADTERVALGFVELDNWWYESEVNRPEAVVTWTPNNNSLPEGLSDFEQPLVAMCGIWSSNTTYAQQNNGSYNFLIEGDYALPTEKNFWVHLFNNTSLKNVSHVYYDFMSEQYGGVSDLQQQAGLAGDWLRNVSEAAAQADLTLTFSQALPSMLLAAAQFPAVTQARVSERYNTSENHQQWDIGVTSLLPAALGLAPFKDTFWTHSQEPGHPASVEENPVLQALVATLSTGLVALGDSADLIKSPLLAQCCRSDGVVLRPATPAVAIDDHIVQSAVGASSSKANAGHVWKSLSAVTTTCDGGGLYHQGIIVAVNTSGQYNVTPKMVFPQLFENQKKLRAWSVDMENSTVWWHEFSQEHPLLLPPGCWSVEGASLRCLFYVSTPLLVHGGATEVHLCGQIGKFVPLSPQRVHLVNTTEGVTVTLAGAPGETLVFDYYVNDQRRWDYVTIESNGLATLALNLTWTTTTTTTTAPTSAKKTSAVPSTTSHSSSGFSAHLQLTWLFGRVCVVTFAALLARSAFLPSGGI